MFKYNNYYAVHNFVLIIATDTYLYSTDLMRSHCRHDISAWYHKLYNAVNAMQFEIPDQGRSRPI
jgi:hypothetical protein